MSEPVISKELIQRLELLSRNAASAIGRRDALVTRDEALTRAVAMAKGEIELKPEVEEVLEQLQKAAHERSVGAFERLLTAIVQDVLPDDNLEIKLDLHTERNMPALDISALNAGKRESIYDGNGGALTNVVCTGLRFIALARSGLRRFIILDEADNWISPFSVSAYFNVVASLARDAQIQTILITHHDPANFSDDFHMLRVSRSESTDGHPASVVSALGPVPPAPEDSDGFIAWVELENFARFEKARYDLSSGVTAIVGEHHTGKSPNNIGKSVIGRAFKAAFLGEGDDTMIRHGAPFCVARFGFSDGRVLEYKRMTKGNPKAVYTLHSPDSFAGVPGAEPLHVTPAAKLPDWVPVETGIGTVDGLDVQIGHQKKSVFMLDEPASKRASLLSIGRESGFLHAMSDLYKDDLRERGRTAREGEKELTVLRLALEHSKSLPEIAPKVAELSAQAAEIEAETQALGKARELANRIAEAAQAHDLIHRQQQVLAQLGEPPAVELTAQASDMAGRIEALQRVASMKIDVLVPELPVLEKTAAAAECIAEINALQQQVTGLSERLARVPALADAPSIEPTVAATELASAISKLSSIPKIQLPELQSPPEVVSSREVANLLQLMASAEKNAASVAREADRVGREIIEVEASIKKATDVLGNECPTCHGYMDAEVVLGHKEHHHDHEHHGSEASGAGRAMTP